MMISQFTFHWKIIPSSATSSFYRLVKNFLLAVYWAQVKRFPGVDISDEHIAQGFRYI